MTGPVPVSTFVERALYDPDLGFYESGGRAGRTRGDFVTSPEVGPLFGAVLGRAMDGWWEAMGRPDPFVVHEHGAGPGTLARTVLVDPPTCAGSLRWVLVERSAAQRALHPDHLPHVGAPGDDPWGEPAAGPLVASAEDAPTGTVHVVVANELLDNLPFDLAERTADGWSEVRLASAGTPVTDDAPGEPHPVEEVLVDLDPERSAVLDRLVPSPATGARVPLQGRAAAWVSEAMARLEPGGRLVVLDYGSSTNDMASRPWTEWVRTYRAQGPGGAPWHAPGSQDITVEVAVDQLPPADRVRTQAEALRSWGIDGLVEEGRAAWRERSAALDLPTLRVRSRVAESQALLDPAGLGGFVVLEWIVP